MNQNNNLRYILFTNIESCLIGFLANVIFQSLVYEQTDNRMIMLLSRIICMAVIVLISLFGLSSKIYDKFYIILSLLWMPYTYFFLKLSWMILPTIVTDTNNNSGNGFMIIIYAAFMIIMIPMLKIIRLFSLFK